MLRQGRSRRTAVVAPRPRVPAGPRKPGSPAWLPTSAPSPNWSPAGLSSLDLGSRSIGLIEGRRSCTKRSAAGRAVVVRDPEDRCGATVDGTPRRLAPSPMQAQGYLAATTIPGPARRLRRCAGHRRASRSASDLDSSGGARNDGASPSTNPSGSTWARGADEQAACAGSSWHRQVPAEVARSPRSPCAKSPGAARWS